MSRVKPTALVVVVALAGLAVAVSVLRSDAESPTPSGQSRLSQGTVLLIPGYGGGTRHLAALAAELERTGIDTEFVDVGSGDQDLREYAARVAERAETLGTTQPAPDLVGYSAGGLTARIAATDHPELFRKVVTLAAPNAGTQAAELGARFGQCPPACEQMRPGSELLKSLPEPDDPSTWLTIWSDTDSVIRPPDSSVLPGTTDYKLQDSCDRTVDHGNVPTDPQTIEAVTAFLASRILPDGCVT